MSIRFCDYNLSGETISHLLGERNSGISPVAHLPMPEHKALALHFAQIEKARAELQQYQADETDEDFFDFGPEDFDSNPSQAEALYEQLSAWRELQAQRGSNQLTEPAVGGETAINEVEPNTKEASKKPVSSTVGNSAE